MIARPLRLRRLSPPRASTPCPEGCDHGAITTPIYWSPDVQGWTADRVQCEACEGQGWARLQIPPGLGSDRRLAPPRLPVAPFEDDLLPF